MKKIIAAAVVAVFALVPIACKESSEGGSPGTPSSFKFVREGTQALDPTLKPGESKTIEVKLSRGSDFKRAVALSVKGTDKVDAELDPKSAKENESPVIHVKVTAKSDAPDGENQVVLTGTPEGGGNATTETIKVSIKK
ncbi:MAG TPA: hypothetical protein VKE74_24745 [Gemmataceae bacterium]|nr:hypothetical protein [Gemmataceae bacterium]